MRLRDLCLLAALLTACEGETRIAEMHLPPGTDDAPWLTERAAQQRADASEFLVNVDFGFADRLLESGITYVNRVVDDAGRLYKAVHYDHGNAVAVADIDGDGLFDVYFTNQAGPNSMWRNLGAGRFEDVTASAGVGQGDRIGVAASFADIDNDGDPDLFTTSVRGGNTLFENDGSGRFTDITSRAQVAHIGHSSSAEFFDYDRDGLLDLFVTNVGRYTTEAVLPAGDIQYHVGLVDAFSGHLHADRTETSLLYRNLGAGRFEEVTEATGLVEGGWTGEAQPVDLNRDGWQDLYVLNMQGPDSYWENVGGTGFVERAGEVFGATPWGAMGIQLLDWNNDGLQDLFIADMHSDMWEVDSIDRFLPESGEGLRPLASSVPPVEYLGGAGPWIFGNALFEQGEDGRFVDVAQEVGVETYWPWGSSAGDLNADGWTDLFVTASMNFPFRYQPNAVLLNELGARFRRAEFLLSVEPRAVGRLVTDWFELDCVERDADSESCASGLAERVRVSAAIGSRSSVVFDLDGDGDLDVITNDFHSPPLVLVSDLAERDPALSFLEVALEGVVSNRDGLGASVTLRVGDRRLHQTNDGQSGYLSQSSLPLYFGLGGAGSVDRIEVRWPSGSVQVVEGPIAPNQRLAVRERP